MRYYLHGNESLDGTTLNLDSRCSHFNNFAVEHLVLFRAAGDSEELNLENDIATGVLNHTVSDVLVDLHVNYKDDVTMLRVTGAFELLFNPIHSG